jgi:hypothetical protein
VQQTGGFHLEENEDAAARVPQPGYGAGHVAAVHQGYGGGSTAVTGALQNTGNGLEDDEDEGPVRIPRPKRQRRNVIVDEEEEDVEVI